MKFPDLVSASKRLVFRRATEENLSANGHLNMKLEQTEALEQRLCKACGFCCDGTLFLHVRISESEPIRAYKKAGLQLMDSPEGKVTMRQPCSGFSKGSCQTYHCRPLRCGEFKCALLKQASEGAVTESNALEVIRETKKIRSRYTALLHQIFPEFEQKSIVSTYRQIRKASKHLSGEALKLFRARKSQLKEYRESLQEALDLHFYDSQGKEDDDRSKST